ncbi:hypothetical protein B0H14DRAFT_3137980 [Mycena olivaceomarginata]|nr:hypothetical protein B0H14DRAFT_3137980 [Mycena olivaceomarginata]
MVCMVPSAREAGMERGSGGQRAHGQRDRVHRRRLSGAHGAGIEGLGGGGGGEQRARMGAKTERGSGGQANHQARNGAVGNERAGGGSVPEGAGCRERKGEVKGGIGGDIRYAGWARMRGNKQAPRKPAEAGTGVGPTVANYGALGEMEGLKSVEIVVETGKRNMLAKLQGDEESQRRRGARAVEETRHGYGDGNEMIAPFVGKEMPESTDGTETVSTVRRPSQTGTGRSPIAILSRHSARVPQRRRVRPRIMWIVWGRERGNTTGQEALDLWIVE